MNIAAAQTLDPTGASGVLYQYGAIGVICFLLIMAVVYLFKELKLSIKDCQLLQKEILVQQIAQHAQQILLQEKRIEEQKLNIVALHDNTAAMNRLTEVVRVALGVKN